MNIVCSDLEGVFVPEIWLELADLTGIGELRRTTRDEPDYAKLMDSRIEILRANKIRIADIIAVAEKIEPMAGALPFLEWLRGNFQLIILSDTYYELTGPLMQKLGRPTLFCHRLEVAEDGEITGYRLRMPDHKRSAVRHLHDLNFHVLAMGDSYNDTGMLAEADTGFLFCAPDNVKADFPQFDAVDGYDDLRKKLEGAARL